MKFLLRKMEELKLAISRFGCDTQLIKQRPILIIARQVKGSNIIYLQHEIPQLLSRWDSWILSLGATGLATWFMGGG